MKKLAFLLPKYNTSLCLKKSIDSVLNQTFNDFGVNKIILLIENKYSNNLREECHLF
jgi:glycosyltransferase involved in cell wall biosynthesis